MNTPFGEIRSAVEERIQTLLSGFSHPASLYEPIRYVMSGGGKRVRPLLVILAARSLGASTEEALNPAVAVEMLHNFTLVHDDIMDRDDTRRGRPTVHVRWDDGTAILAGDALIGVAYDALTRYQGPRLGEMVRTFNGGVIEVCEGQALDKEFEGRRDVRLEEYDRMIALKTGKLISMSARLGALLANGDTAQVEALERFGSLLGRAFQIQDDLLDYTSTTSELGKRVGSDLAMQKSTFVTLSARDTLPAEMRAQYDRLIGTREPDEGLLLELGTLLQEGGVLAAGEAQVEELTHQALTVLDDILPEERREELRQFASWILHRKN